MGADSSALLYRLHQPSCVRPWWTCCGLVWVSSKFFRVHCTILAPTFRSPTRVSLQSWLLRIFRISFTDVSAFLIKHPQFNALYEYAHNATRFLWV